MNTIPGFHSERSLVLPAMMAQNPRPSTTGVNAPPFTAAEQSCLDKCHVTAAGCLFGALFTGGLGAASCMSNMFTCQLNCTS
jgi:hypothetical protein